MHAATWTDPTPVALPGADLLLYERLEVDDQLLLAELIRDTRWSREWITLFGKTHPQPRLVAYYGDAGARYTYSGTRHEPLPWTPRLQQLRQLIESRCGARFNSVLLNYYRDGRDSMGMHADDEPELGEQPTIASFSLGAERKLHFQPRVKHAQENVSFILPSGSLLIMRGDTQRNWKHGVHKLRRPCGPRLNLTFRQILSPHAGAPPTGHPETAQ